MKQIKTIIEKNPEAFDEEVNAALGAGWNLTRRDVFSGHYFLAEMEKETEETKKCCEACGMERCTDEPCQKSKGESLKERRVCMFEYLEGKEKKKVRAFFHAFTTRAYPVEPSPLKGGHTGGQVIDPYAIIELEDGMVGLADLTSIKFIDNDTEAKK